MKKIIILVLIFICPFFLLFGSLFIRFDTLPDFLKFYQKKIYMIPMRDGVKLYTEVLCPINYSNSFPFLINRTPYGASTVMAENSIFRAEHTGVKAKIGYIIVYQDIREKFESEGEFEMCRPLYHLTDKTKTDESTDAWDTIDWLIKNIKNNNGKAGIYGVSYPGCMALDASVDPHPALRASSPQASPVDMFLGDDFHHNGAFRLSYAFEYCYMVQNAKESNSHFPFPQFDLYDWYLKLGPLKNFNEKYFRGKIPSWNDFVKHPNYDKYWMQQSRLKSIKRPQIPILFVGGYFDQEDMNGPQIIYSQLEKKDSADLNFIVLGPWNHGQWGSAVADSLGKISFGSNTAIWFQNLEKKWFDFWLKGIGDGKFSEANCFQTGSNRWQKYRNWPPQNAEIKRLYIHADFSTSFTKPDLIKGSVSYISDPAKPVPYRTQPIEATYGINSRWDSWHVEDQRFASSRPDVITFTGDSLVENLTVTGKVTVHLFASTTGSDADFIVKLIDVFPNFNRKDILMSGYELPIAMEVFRGRFLKSYENPKPLVPNKPEEFVIDLHQINHSFMKGHRLMIQIQSTWFPIIDRNPQKFVPNIFEASENDFIKATQTIFCNGQYATYIELPVMTD